MSNCHRPVPSSKIDQRVESSLTDASFGRSVPSNSSQTKYQFFFAHDEQRINSVDYLRRFECRKISVYGWISAIGLWNLL
jgi:hypothetical protein